MVEIEQCSVTPKDYVEQEITFNLKWFVQVSIEKNGVQTDQEDESLGNGSKCPTNKRIKIERSLRGKI